MTNQTEANASVLTIGQKAISQWKTADGANSKGDALATYALVQASKVLTFSCAVLNAKGEVEEELEGFDLFDFMRPETFKAEDGKRNNKLMSAAREAIASKVFGLKADQIDSPFKSRMDRCLVVVKYLLNLDPEADRIALTSKNELIVPYEAMKLKPEGKDGKEPDANQLAIWEAMYKDGKGVWTVTSKHGESFAELRKMAQPRKPRGQDQQKTVDPIVSFVTSVKHALTVVHQINMEPEDDDNAQASVALSNENRRVLFELYQELADYFKADPMEETAKRTGTK